MLAFRGLAGYVPCMRMDPELTDVSTYRRFVGLFGTYYALQYLSLSDTTVLSFLTPMATAVTGALLLKENLTAKQVLASCMHLRTVLAFSCATYRSPDSIQLRRRSAHCEA